MTLDFVSHPFWQRLSLVLVHFVWQAAVVAVCAGLLLAAFRPRRPQTRYTVWLTAFLALPCCAALTFWLVDTPGAGIAAPQVGSLDGEVAPRVPSGGASTGTHSPQADSADSLKVSWMRELDATRPWLVLGWLAGVGLFSLRLVCGAAAIAWIRWRAAGANAELIERARRLSTRLGVRLPRVVISRDVRQALAAGLIRPVIVLPASWATGLSPAMVEAVLAHELAHLRRHDVWLNAFQRVVETVLFYHPAVWWLSARVRAERELCCDDLAVTATGDRLAYASALELAVRGSLPARGLLLANGIGGRKMAVLERVRHVLNLEPSRSRGWWPGGLAAVAVPALVWCAAAAWQPAQADQPELALVQEGEREVDEERGDRDEPRPDREERESDVERERDEAREQRERAQRQRDVAEDRREDAGRDQQRRLSDERWDIIQRRAEQRDEAMERARRAEEEFRQRADDFRNRAQHEGHNPREREADADRPGGPGFNPFRSEGRVEIEIDRRGDLPPAQRELLEVVRELRHEVEQLRREVQELRESRPDRPAARGSSRFGDGPPRDRDDDRGRGDRGGFGRRPPGPPDRPFPPRDFRPPVEGDRDFRDRGRPEGPERDRPDREGPERDRPDRERPERDGPDRDRPDREQPVRDRDDARERDRGRPEGDRPRETREQDSPERDDDAQPERDDDRPRGDDAAAEAPAADGPVPLGFDFRIPALFHELDGAAGDVDGEGSRAFEFFIGVTR